jgi:hypothetical protein
MLDEAQLRVFFEHLHETCQVCRYRPEGRTAASCTNDRCICYDLRNIWNNSRTDKKIFNRFLMQKKIQKPPEPRRDDDRYPTI